MADALDEASLTREVHALCERLHASLAASDRGTLVRYVHALARFGAHTDLVGARTAEALVTIALADALVLARHQALLPSPVIEAGAGGASLLLPLALLVPSIEGRAIEPRQKRATFLRMTVGSFALINRVRIGQERIDPKKPGAREWGSAMARAVWAPPEWIQVAGSLVRDDGSIVVHSTASIAVPDGWTCALEERYVPSETLREARVVTILRRG